MRYKTIKFRDACKLVRGISYKSSDYTDENDENGEIFVNLKCVMPNGFRQDGIKYFNGSHKENQYVNNGDLLIANTDLTRNREVIGNSILVPEFNKKACFSMDLTKIEITDESILDRMYLYYYLKSPKARWFMINHSDGSTVVHLSTRSIPEMDLEIPDLETQKKIVHILSALDQKIELNNQQNKTLNETAEAIFKSQFGDRVRDDKTICDFLLPKRGKPLLSKDVREGNIPVVAGGLEPATYHNQSNTLSPVITISASGANAGFVRLWGEKVWSSDSSYIDNSITDYVYFWYVLLKTRQKEIYDTQTGSAQAHIYPKHIGDMSIGDINDEMMSSYNETVKVLFEKLFENERENKTMLSLRGTLLPKLMSGEINLDKVTM